MLHIRMDRAGSSTNLWKIEGLTDQELDELNSMEYREMKQKVLEIIDSREHDYWDKSLGTTWFCGNGVYNVYIIGRVLYAEVGKSCD